MATATTELLREQVQGDVITPGDEGYDEARAVYNAMIDRRPRVVVRCRRAADVIAAVNFARENDLDLAVRGGSHSVPGFGTCDDGVVVDLSGMRGVTVDPARSTARAEGGATWGDFNDATHAHGLATTGGIISTTGVGGLTLGGGIGYLARGFGLSCDNLVSAEIVTADGRLVVASENENENLFWAIRGGAATSASSPRSSSGSIRSRTSTADRCSSRSSTQPTFSGSTASSSSTRPSSSAASRPGRSPRRFRSSRRTGTGTRSSPS